MMQEEDEYLRLEAEIKDREKQVKEREDQIKALENEIHESSSRLEERDSMVYPHHWLLVHLVQVIVLESSLANPIPGL
jgi:hypothetical protein